MSGIFKVAAILMAQQHQHAQAEIMKVGPRSTWRDAPPPAHWL